MALLRITVFINKNQFEGGAFYLVGAYWNMDTKSNHYSNSLLNVSDVSLVTC